MHTDYLNNVRICRRQVRPDQLQAGWKYMTDSGMGGVFPIRYEGQRVTPIGLARVFIVDNPHSSFHGNELIYNDVDLPEHVWVELSLPLIGNNTIDRAAADLLGLVGGSKVGELERAVDGDASLDELVAQMVVAQGGLWGGLKTCDPVLRQASAYAYITLIHHLFALGWGQGE